MDLLDLILVPGAETIGGIIFKFALDFTHVLSMCHVALGPPGIPVGS